MQRAVVLEQEELALGHRRARTRAGSGRCSSRRASTAGAAASRPAGTCACPWSSRSSAHRKFRSGSGLLGALLGLLRDLLGTGVTVGSASNATSGFETSCGRAREREHGAAGDQHGEHHARRPGEASSWPSWALQGSRGGLTEDCGMDPLRAAPGAESCSPPWPASRACYVVGGAVRDALLGRVAARARPGRRGRRGRRRAARRRARRRHADRPRALRDGDHRAPASSPSTSRARAASATRGRARCRRSSWARRSRRTWRGGTSRVNAMAVRAGRRDAYGVAGRPRGPRARRPARAARPLVRRRPDADAAARPLRRAARVRARPGHGGADRPARCARRSPATALGNELRLLLREPPSALRLLERYGLGRGAARATASSTWLAERAGRARSRSRPAASGPARRARRAPRPPRVHGAATAI